MTLADDLRAAKALMADPDKSAFGRKSDGLTLTLALDHVAGGNDEAWYALSRAVQHQVTVDDFVDWSWRDNRTHADIMALFDRAIAAAESDK